MPQGVQDFQFSITPFSATPNCGSYANTWSYSGFNNSNGDDLSPAVDFIYIKSTTGSIFVS